MHLVAPRELVGAEDVRNKERGTPKYMMVSGAVGEGVREKKRLRERIKCKDT